VVDAGWVVVVGFGFKVVGPSLGMVGSVSGSSEEVIPGVVGNPVVVIGALVVVVGGLAVVSFGLSRWSQSVCPG